MRLIELQECCRIVNGSTPSRNKREYWGGDIFWFTPKDLSGLESKYIEDSPECITLEGYNSCSTTMIPSGSLLFTSRAPIGHLAINKKEACTNQGFKTLVPNEGVDVEYLYYVLKKNVPQLQDLGNGATFKELSKSTISKFKIPLPPLEEQKKIAAILDAADDYRQKTKALIDKYDQLTQSLFLDMFGDPVTNPKGWTIKQIKEIAKVLNGTTPKTSDSQYWDGEYSWVTPAEIKSKYLTKTNRYLTKEGVLSKSLKIIERNNVLLTSRAPIGKVCINKIDTYTNQGFKSMIIYRDMINAQYLYQILVLSESRLNQLGRGATFKEISKSIVEEFELTVPNLTLQNQFAERVAQIEKQKQQAETSLIKAEELFSSLLQRAFKGELTN
jgi:type I restriction enzyme S subunit